MATVRDRRRVCIGGRCRTAWKPSLAEIDQAGCDCKIGDGQAAGRCRVARRRTTDCSAETPLSSTVDAALDPTPGWSASHLHVLGSATANQLIWQGRARASTAPTRIRKRHPPRMFLPQQERSLRITPIGWSGSVVGSDAALPVQAVRSRASTGAHVAER